MAELSKERMDALMAYCRLDELAPGEDGILGDMYLDAVAQLNQAGVSVPPAGTGRAAQFDMLVNALVLDAWDNRGTQTAGAALAENPAFRRRLNQLKQTEPVPGVGTGSAG